MINLSAVKENVDFEIEASKKESPDTFRCGMLLAEIVSEALEQQIAADVVEVVRCRACIYNSNGSCTHSEIYDDTNYNPNYYCADGERREGND